MRANLASYAGFNTGTMPLFTMMRKGMPP